jgi:murein DD-endopeptidase MepM/ murein hydrolase activator NlpD
MKFLRPWDLVPTAVLRPKLWRYFVGFVFVLGFTWGLGAIASTCDTAHAQTPPARSFPTLDAHVPVPPAPLIGGGRTHLVYELYLANLSPRETTLEAIDVRDPAAPEQVAPLLRLEGTALDTAIQRAGVPVDAAHKRVLQGGQLAIVFVWVTLPPGAPTPAELTHRFAIHVIEPAKSTSPPAPTQTSTPQTTATTATGTIGGGTRTSNGGQVLTVDGVTVRVSGHAPRIIASPLQGDSWLAANGPDNSTGHRRALIALAGQGRIAQRYAIDWIQLYPDGKTWKGDPLKNTSYRCYGTSALAVADGVVVETQDGIPQNVPGATSRAVAITPETLGGNFVLLDIGQGAFAYYAHLQPGSLKVKKGDSVHRGQVLGLVGNSGNSTEPHLHFHIADRNAAIDSEGLPYAFETFELQAPPDRVTAAMKPAGESLAIDPSVMGTLGSSRAPVRHGEIPMMNAIVRFPSASSAAAASAQPAISNRR